MHSFITPSYLLPYFYPSILFHSLHLYIHIHALIPPLHPLIPPSPSSNHSYIHSFIAFSSTHPSIPPSLHPLHLLHLIIHTFITPLPSFYILHLIIQFIIHSSPFNPLVPPSSSSMHPMIRHYNNNVNISTALHSPKRAAYCTS